MEMERINEDTIRVLISNDDLNERGITVLDLLGNHKQIESFFYSILEEVDVDHQFQENDAVTFQVLPTRTGLELFISKNNGDLTDSLEKHLKESGNDAHVDAQDQVSDFLKHKLTQTDAEHDDVPDVHINSDGAPDMANYIDEQKTSPTKTVVLKLHDFEDLISISKLLKPDNMASSLYKYRNNYFLTMVYYVDQTSSGTIKDEMAVALEYADKTKVTADILSEHGELVMEHAAIEMAQKYFK